MITIPFLPNTMMPVWNILSRWLLLVLLLDIVEKRNRIRVHDSRNSPRRRAALEFTGTIGRAPRYTREKERQGRPAIGAEAIADRAEPHARDVPPRHRIHRMQPFGGRRILLRFLVLHPFLRETVYVRVALEVRVEINSTLVEGVGENAATLVEGVARIHGTRDFVERPLHVVERGIIRRHRLLRRRH